VRELDQALAAALLLAKGEPIALEHLPAAIRSPATFKSVAAVAREPPSAPAPTPGEASLFDELKRRRVFRSLVAYGLVAFAVLQIIEPIMHGLHWPDEILTYVVLALAAGFLLTALLSWAYDLRAGRILRVPPRSGLRRGRLAALLLAVGVLAAAPGLAWYFLVHGRAVPAIRAADLSIAVLRFGESTPGYQQDPFSGGVAQKIAAALAHVEGLQVSGPIEPSGPQQVESVNPRDARMLKAAHVVEGAVQRDNGKLRVIVKIVRLADDQLLWSKTFEGEAAGQVALQDDIAREVVAALQARLPPKNR
jgi:TolB-like protein